MRVGASYRGWFVRLCAAAFSLALLGCSDPASERENAELEFGRRGPFGHGQPGGHGPSGGFGRGHGHGHGHHRDCRSATFEGRDYLFCSIDKKWVDARRFCEERGLDLVAIDSEAENAFVASKTREESFIGATDMQEEGHWVWSSTGAEFWTGGPGGTAVGGAYENWSFREPRSISGGRHHARRGGRDCGTIGDHPSTWHARDCRSHKGFVCEEPVPPQPPQLPTPLSPPPPMANGCYERQRIGWVSVPCAEPGFVEENFGRPDVDVSLDSDAFMDGGTPTQIPYVYAQYQAFVPVVGSAADTFVNQMVDVCPAFVDDPAIPACVGSFDGGPNHWSFQANTNAFTGNNGSRDAVQFVLQSNGVNNAICVWNIDADNQVYEDECVVPRPPQRDGGLQPFDWGNVAGYIDSATGKLVVQAAMTWIEPGEPYEYAVVADDMFGLAGNWFAFDGNILGEGCCSELQFTDAMVLSRIAASSCPGDTPATENVSACTGPELETHVSIQNTSVTAETNNLTQFVAPSVSFPNPWLALANWTSTTGGACVDPQHAYVKDYPTDMGQIPSNLNGQAFWESPDVIVVPEGTPVDVDTTASQTLLTAGDTFDFYVRVNNDLGCADVVGAKALIYLADPGSLDVQWVPVTGEEYLGDDEALDGDTVPAGGRALIGPFPYTVPDTELGTGHKCLIAAILAENEPEVTDSFDAPNSNQVGQRNVEVGVCAFPLTNGQTEDGDLTITLSIAPPELFTGTTILVDFSDADSSWFNVWSAQMGAGTDFLVTHVGDTTTVQLLIASVTLDEVDLLAGETRTALGSMALPFSHPETTLNIQGELRDSADTVLVTNGGSCKATGQSPPG